MLVQYWLILYHAYSDTSVQQPCSMISVRLYVLTHSSIKGQRHELQLAEMYVSVVSWYVHSSSPRSSPVSSQ
ncbi:hypothetical protein D9M71_761450 [compost metagenome]